MGGDPARAEPRATRTTLWDRWLGVAVVMVIAYAVVLVVHGRAAGLLFDNLGFGMTDSAVGDGAARRYVLFLYGVLGAVIIGWMTMLLALVRGPLRSGQRWAWNAVALSVTAWFTIDTAFSLAVGSPSHAAFNLVFAGALGVPLAAMRRQLRG